MDRFDALLPRPVSVRPKPGSLRITHDFSLKIEGEPGERLSKAALRFQKRLADKTGLFLEAGEPGQCALVLQCERVGELVLGEDERYSLDVTPTQAVLRATTDIGVLRGLETLLQLISADEEGYIIPCVEIDDEPRFPWRGLMIDSARRFQPLDVLKRNLDGMAAVKLNVFHWHLTDDQGFRVESNEFPLLHELGSNGEYYTKEQIRDIVAYAHDRGIRVIPEFDLPGHAASWVIGYPELASAPGPHVRHIDIGVLDQVLNPIKESTYGFLERFFAEMITLFPDEYVHIGGDENNGKQWLANPEIVQFMREHDFETILDMQSYFTERVLGILTRLGKKMIGWDEILTPNLPATAVIQSWRGRESLVEGARAGHKIILSNGYYIDLCQPAEYHYLNDPLPSDMELTPQESTNILGGEATMWSEVVSPETIDSRIWPRTAAIAERLWSRREDCRSEDLYERLDVISLHLEELGLTHEKNYPQMLRRLARGRKISPLQTLLDVCEPVQGYERVIQRKYTVLSPLTRAVDAARPDARGAREFRNLVRHYQGEVATGSRLKERLRIWAQNHEALAPIIEHSPVLQEITDLSRSLSTIATLALECLESPGRSLNEHEKTALAEAKEPRGQLQLVVVSAIEDLLTKER